MHLFSSSHVLPPPLRQRCLIGKVPIFWVPSRCAFHGVVLFEGRMRILALRKTRTKQIFGLCRITFLPPLAVRFYGFLVGALRGCGPMAEDKAKGGIVLGSCMRQYMTCTR